MRNLARLCQALWVSYDINKQHESLENHFDNTIPNGYFPVLALVLYR